MRSKKWQHFSTSVPPVLRLKRFQSPTFFRNGNRCSRTNTMCSVPERALVDLAQELRDRRHVPVLETDPHDARARRRGVGDTARQSSTVVHSGFSTSTGRSGRRVEDLGEHRRVGDVRRRDHDRVEVAVEHVGDDRCQTAAGWSSPSVRLAHFRESASRIGDRDDLGVGQREEIAQVLATHHAGADHPETQRHGPVP